MSKPLILVSNDDGISSHGIRNLVNCMKELGDVVVVAPAGPQSGMGHAITIGNTLRLDQTDIFGELLAYECSGTPADCVKLAKYFVTKERKPDLVVSGINHGSNSSISVLYSGTMSAAMEAAIEGMPAIGFSLCDYNINAPMDHIMPSVKKIARQVLDRGLPKGVALNVNMPSKREEPVKGIRICRQARAKWQEIFEERKDPQGRRYFWMNGSFINQDKGEDTDERSLRENYVTVVPCGFDMTAHHAITVLNEEWDIQAGSEA